MVNWAGFLTCPLATVSFGFLPLVEVQTDKCFKDFAFDFLKVLDIFCYIFITLYKNHDLKVYQFIA